MRAVTLDRVDGLRLSEMAQSNAMCWALLRNDAVNHQLCSEY